MLRLKKLLEDTPIGLNGYAKLLDMNNKALYNKLTGKSHFTYPEYLKLRELFPDRNIDYLLTADQDSIQSSAPPDRGAGASIIER